MTDIFTIGYEKASPDQFDHKLLDANIEVLVDVRAVAISRRKGFSKSALQDRIANVGIDYLHLKALGDPKAGREAARSGNFRLFMDIYAAHLATAEASQALTQLLELVAKRRAALLCYEADAQHCHRLMVAKELAKMADLSIVELSPLSATIPRRGRPGTGGHPGEGLAAA